MKSSWFALKTTSFCRRTLYGDWILWLLCLTPTLQVWCLETKTLQTAPAPDQTLHRAGPGVYGCKIKSSSLQALLLWEIMSFLWRNIETFGPLVSTLFHAFFIGWFIWIKPVGRRDCERLDSSGKIGSICCLSVQSFDTRRGVWLRPRTFPSWHGSCVPYSPFPRHSVADHLRPASPWCWLDRGLHIPFCPAVHWTLTRRANHAIYTLMSDIFYQCRISIVINSLSFPGFWRWQFLKMFHSDFILGFCELAINNIIFQLQ